MAKKTEQHTAKSKDLLKNEVYWFKRRRYGWGWVPTTWQGWLVVLSGISIILGSAVAAVRISPQQLNENVLLYILFIYAIAAVLIGISYKKGPKPRWRWGTRDTDNPDEDY